MILRRDGLREDVRGRFVIAELCLWSVGIPNDHYEGTVWLGAR
jgi:hypothetical protein